MVPVRVSTLSRNGRLRVRCGGEYQLFGLLYLSQSRRMNLAFGKILKGERVTMKASGGLQFLIFTRALICIEEPQRARVEA